MKKLLSIFIIVALFISPLICRAEEKQEINDVYAIIFIMDGLNYNTFMSAVKKGLAPNIKKYFFDEGAVFTNALALFPTASPNNYLAAISGLFSGHSGTMYLGWFDRSIQKPVSYYSLNGLKYLDHELINFRALLDPQEEDLHPPSTIFDYLRGDKTAAIYSFYRSGAAIKNPKNPIPAFWSTFSSGREEMLDIYAFRHVLKLFNNAPHDIPRFTIVGLYSIDAHGHHYDADSPMVDYTIEQLDQLLNQFFDLIKEKGTYNKTYVILAADHGMHNTPKSKFNLKGYVKNTGLTLYPGQPRRDNYNTYVASRGIASAHIYIKSENGWRERPSYERLRSYPLANGKSIDIPKKLLDADEIRFVVVRDGYHKVQVISEEGRGIITYFPRVGTDWYSYHVVEGRDPLEMNNSSAAKMVGGKFYAADPWGKKTAGHKFPDAVVQLGQVFADGRAGDIFVIAEPDWVFYRAKSATHGTIAKDDVHIPMLMHGPTVPKGTYGFARMADIFPTMLDWYGIEDKGRHDGRHLFKSKIPNPKSQANFKSQISSLRKIRGKLEKLRDDLRLQKEDPEQYHFTPGVALEANLWLIEEQLKRLDEYAKIFLQ